MKQIISILIIASLFAACSKDGGAEYSPSVGRGGSMARFTIVDNVLYTVSNKDLKVIGITDAADPKYYPERDVPVGFDIETIFPMDGSLFIGSRSSLYIYDISAPYFPLLLSQVGHLRSCDPVVAQGNYAYVTLNTNSVGCGGTSNNVLLIYNISDLKNPILEKTVQMFGPQGLGIDGDILFVCDIGLKVFDISDPLNIRQISDLAGIGDVDVRAAYDVIPVDGLLILVAKEGLFQFDYSGSKLEFLSKITIKQQTP